MFSAFARFLRGKAFRAGRNQETSHRQRFRPWLEELESRLVPAPVWVTNNAGDDRAGSLRAAVDAAETGDTIEFRISNQTIALGANGEMETDQDLIIDGGNQNITIDAGHNSRVFNFTGTDAVDETVSNLTFTGGATGAGNVGGVLFARGGIELTNDWFRSSTADGGGAVAVQSVESL